MLLSIMLFNDLLHINNALWVDLFVLLWHYVTLSGTQWH